MKFHAPRLCLMVLICTSPLPAAESSLILKMPPGWAGFELEATVETGFRPAGLSSPEVLTSDMQTAMVSPTAGHVANETIAVPTAMSIATPDNGGPKDKAEASLDLRYIVGNDGDHDEFSFDFTTITSAVNAGVDFGSGNQKADAFAKVTVIVRSSAPLLAADCPGALFVLPDMPALTDPATEFMLATLRVPYAARPPETPTSYITPLLGYLSAGNPGLSIYLDMLPATPAHGDETLEYIFTYEVVTPFGSDPKFTYSLSGLTGTTSTIVTNTNDSGPGSLRQALVDVPETGGITFAPHLDGQTIALTSGQLEVTGRNFSINAQDLPNKITIDAGRASRVMQATSGADLLIRNVRLTGGNATGAGIDTRGGGIRVHDSALVLIDCEVTGNQASGSGGGISCDGSTLILERTLVEDNTAGASGGGLIANRNEFNITEVLLRDSEFRDNSAGDDGGAISQDGSAYPNFEFTRCSFIDNDATGRGGALYRTQGPYDHCTFEGNVAGLQAGAILQTLATEIRHCTITGNSAPHGEGGGVYVAGATTTVFSSIIAGNTGGDVDILTSSPTAAYSSAGFNMIGSGSGDGAFTSGGDVTAISDPLLTPPGDFGGPTTTLLPLLTSPATDAGATDLDSPDIDQRGFPRVVDGNGDSTAVADAGAAETEQAIILVTNGNDSGPGSLRQAIADIPDGGLILFGFTSSPITLSSGDLAISGKTLTINGLENFGGPRKSVTVLANESSRIFHINGGANVTVQGLRLIEGRPNSGFIAGGAIWNEATLSLTDCELSQSSSSDGGALYNAPGAMATLLRCRVSDNHSTDLAGAIHNSGTLILTDTTICGNVAQNGGGLYLQGSSQATHLSACTIANNLSQQRGGGINLTAGILNVRNSCFHGNVSRGTGGALNARHGSTAILSQTTIWGNVAGDAGGAISGEGFDGPLTGSISLRHSTITGNNAPDGGGIQLGAPRAPGPALSAFSTIIAGNSHDDLGSLSAVVFSDGYNVVGTGPGASLFTSVGDQRGVLDPSLSPLGDYGHPSPTMLPLPGSPAMEAGGLSGSTPALDSRGQPRVQDGDGTGPALIDAGAAEAAPPSTEIHVINPNDSGPGSLRQALADATIPGTRIVFDPMVDGKLFTLTSGPLEVTGKSVFLDAGDLVKGVVLHGNDATRAFTIDDAGAAVLRKIGIRNGWSDPLGGGIAAHGSLSLASCTVKNNQARLAGGGILHFPSAPRSIILVDTTISGNQPMTGANLVGGGLALERLSSGTFVNSRIHGNVANLGGGLVTSGDSAGATVTLRECMFTDNEASRGAGIAQTGSMILSACTLDSNVAPGKGGGIISYRNNLHVFDSTISGNQGLEGGGIACGPDSLSPRVRIEQSTFFSNHAHRYGGAIYLLGGDLNVERCTISDNEALISGGGIAAVGIPQAQARVGSTILSANIGTDVSVVLGPVDSYLSGARNLIGTMAGTTAFGAPTFDQIGILDPVLSTPGDYGGPTQTMIPLPGSPARDSVPSLMLMPNTDQRGFPRIHGPARDAGAYEASGNGGYPVWAMETIPPGDDMTFTGHADGDRNPNGLEYGVGTDPDHSDAGSSNNVSMTANEGVIRIDFGFHPPAFDVIWTVVRSTDLQNWTEIYRYDGTSETLGMDIDSDLDLTNSDITVADTNPPAPESYYRLKVLYTP